MYFSNRKPYCIAPLLRWSTWDARKKSIDTPSVTELDFIDPGLRRRLSPLAKMSLKVAHDCTHGIPIVRFVYASRHGDLNRTTSMLNDLADGTPISPTAFSMSVLNSSPALFSILRNDLSPAIAITASTESFGYGLIEACLQLATYPHHPVLFVYADEPAPTQYGCAMDDTYAHAIALLLKHGVSTTISSSYESAIETNTVSGETQSRAFIRCLETVQGSAVWHGKEKSWRWRRQEQ